MIGKTVLHYNILEKLGQGGMGVVYLAEDTKLKRQVAIKFLPQQVSSNEQERFKVEAQAAAALNHSNIATIHAIEEFDGELFIAMEFIDGQELKELTNKELPIDKALDYATQIAKGLQAAHNKQIIHRDIKSANIMVTEQDQVKIMDFGLAKIGEGKDLTKDHSTIGTLAYMAPEQILGETVDCRADIFSYGVVLFEMLTGKLPFIGEYESAMMYSILNDDPTSAKEARPDCPDYLVGLVEECLQKEPDNRPQTMQDIIAILEEQIQPTTKISALSRKDNLPVQLTSFIGRAKEIETIENLISENRLVTLTGAGGCGKTRLAIQVSENMIHQFPDGVWLAELASLTEANQIDNAIATIFQITEQAGKTLLDILQNYFSDKNLLLVIDNCEHLISACSNIVEIFLKAAPNVRILTTSRETLNISGELAWRVPSLSLPTDKVDSPKKLSSYEAVQLFLNRGQQALSTFKIDDDNAQIIVDICRRLDGIPLAIELAASRLRMFSPQVILERLDDRFRLLTGGSRTALERHKTLSATIDWSFELLSEKEKVLFRRLSVFVGGCEMDAAEKVCSFPPLDEFEIVNHFTSLIDKSLVLTTEVDGTFRYRLLETIRFYANEKLLQAGEADYVRKSHTDYFSKLAEVAYLEQTEKYQYWPDKIEIELENFKSALDWIKDDVEKLRLAGALGWFWYDHSHITLGLKYLHECEKYKDNKKLFAARAILYNGFLKVYKGDLDGVRIVDETIEYWKVMPDTVEKANSFFEYSVLQTMVGNFDAALETAQAMLRIAEKLNNKYLMLKSKTAKVWVYIAQLDVKNAEPLVEDNLKAADDLNMAKMQAWNLHYFADCSLMKGDYKTTEKRYYNALEGMAELGTTTSVIIEMTGMSFAISGQKRYVKAIRLRGFIDKMYDELCITFLPMKFWLDWIEKYHGGAMRALGEERTKMALQEGRKMNIEQAVEYAQDFDKD